MALVFWRQIIADLRSRKAQVAQLLLILTVGAMTLTVTIMIERGPDIIWNHLSFATIAADASFVARDSGVDLARIQRLDSVTASSGPVPVLRDLTLRQDPLKTPFSLYAAGLEPPPVARPLLTQGRWLRAADEVMIETTYAREIGVRVGSPIEVLSAGRRVQLTIVGLFVSTSSTYPQSPTVTGYALDPALEALQPNHDLWERSLDVRLRGVDSAAFVEQMLRSYPPGEIVASHTWHDNLELARFFNDVTSLGFHLFSLFTLIAVAIMVGSSAGAFAISRFRDIGLLKAIGFTPKQATSLLVAEHLAIGLAASIAGIALGLAFSPFIFPSPYLRQVVNYLPYGWPLIGEPLLWVAVVYILELVVAAATTVAVWPCVRDATVTALAGSRGGDSRTPSILAQMASRLRVPLIVGLGLRNVFSEPWRAPLTIGALVLTIATSTVALSADSVLRAFVEQPGLVGEPASSLVVTSAGMRDADVRALLEAHPEIDSAGSFRVDAQSAESGVPVVVRGVGPGVSDLGLVILEGHAIQETDETVVARGLLDALGLRVGDNLPLVVQGQPLVLHIVGRYYSSSNRGVVAFVPAEALLAALGPTLEPEGYFVRLPDSVDPQTVKDSLIRESQGLLGVRVWDTPEAQQGLRFAFFVVSGALLFIGAITLFNATWLAVHERSRDLGVLKALGLTPKQLVIGVVAGAAIQALVAAIGGAALGYAVTETIYNFAMTQQGGGGAGRAPVNWPWVLLFVVLGAELVVAVSSALPARAAARIHAADVLRNE